MHPPWQSQHIICADLRRLAATRHAGPRGSGRLSLGVLNPPWQSQHIICVGAVHLTATTRALPDAAGRLARPPGRRILFGRPVGYYVALVLELCLRDLGEGAGTTSSARDPRSAPRRRRRCRYMQERSTGACMHGPSALREGGRPHYGPPQPAHTHAHTLRPRTHTPPHFPPQGNGGNPGGPPNNTKNTHPPPTKPETNHPPTQPPTNATSTRPTTPHNIHAAPD